MKDGDIEAVYPIPSRCPTVHSGTDIRADEPSPANANTILVRFRDCKTRDQVIRQRRQLKNTIITIVEDLSSLNVDLMNRLRRSEDFSKCWSWNGHVHALLKDGNKLRVRPFQSIHESGV